MVSLSNTPLNIDDEGLTLVTINGYAIESWLDENYPDTEYVSVNNFAEAFDLLAAGGADAFASGSCPPCKDVRGRQCIQCRHYRTPVRSYRGVQKRHAYSGFHNAKDTGSDSTGKD
jgi:hypothetical protein